MQETIEYLMQYPKQTFGVKKAVVYESADAETQARMLHEEALETRKVNAAFPMRW